MLDTSKHHTVEAPTPSRESDLMHLAEVAAWYTPDFLMRSSLATKSMHRVINPSDVVSSSASGRYRAIREALAGPDLIERAVQELRALVSSSDDNKHDDDRREHQHDDDKRQAVLELWIAVEPCLTEAEHDELCAGVLGRMFPKSAVPGLSRAGHSQAGGQ